VRRRPRRAASSKDVIAGNACYALICIEGYPLALPPPHDASQSRPLQLCRDCFYRAFEEEVHETITQNKLFQPGERIAVAASGGKDSTVLAHVMTTLNARYK